MPESVKINRNVSLAPYCTYRIGGVSDYYAEPACVEDIRQAINFAENAGVSFFVIGKGSNVLISDKGYRGLVINLSHKFCDISFDNEFIIAQSGAELEKVLKVASEKGLGGLESLNDIPGTIGGAVYMNAGAFDCAISDRLVLVSSITSSGDIITRKKDEITFGYRYSDYCKNKEIILSARLHFLRDDVSLIQSRLHTIKQKRDEKQPPDRERSCGSVFKRPPGKYAGTLIEECDLKGFQIGGAKVSEKHANFIINTGNATATDVRNVIEAVQKQVLERSGVTLETEVLFVGD
jgi:UDP-N-acetylmuramate dehydrogenase